MRKVNFNIEISCNKALALEIIRMLKSMEYLGNIGASRELKFFLDGDGVDQPKFKFSAPVSKMIEADKTDSLRFGFGGR